MRNPATALKSCRANLKFAVFLSLSSENPGPSHLSLNLSAELIFQTFPNPSFCPNMDIFSRVPVPFVRLHILPYYSMSFSSSWSITKHSDSTWWHRELMVSLLIPLWIIMSEYLNMVRNQWGILSFHGNQLSALYECNATQQKYLRCPFSTQIWKRNAFLYTLNRNHHR